MKAMHTWMHLAGYALCTLNVPVSSADAECAFTS